MIDWYLKNRQFLRSLHVKATDALRHCEKNEKQAAMTIASYMKADFQLLCEHWHSPCIPRRNSAT